MVERSNLNQILSEAKLGLTGALSQQTVAKIGNLTGAKFIVTGNIERDDSGIHIITRLVNVESGQIESSAEASFSTSINVSEKTERKEVPSDSNKPEPPKSLNIYLAALGKEDENKSELDLVLMNLINGPIINIDKERNSLRDKIARIEEKEKTKPSQELLAEKSRLAKELRACDIMIKGFDALIQNREQDTFKACFKQAKELSPRDPNLMLFDAFLNMDNNDVVKKKIDEVLSISSTTAEAYLFRAFWGNEELTKKSENKNAKEILSEVQKEDRKRKLLKNIITDADRYAFYSGDKLGAISLKIYALLYAKKEQEADALIKKAVADNPANYSLYGVRARYYLETGELELYSLLKMSEKSIEQMKLELGQKITIDKAKYEKQLRQQKAVDKAIEDYSTMVALDPAGIAGRYERADLYRKYKEDYSKAISDLTKLIEIDPSGTWKYLYYRGSCYKSLGQNEDAVKDWEKSVEKKPSYIYPVDELAIYYREKKDVDNTIKYLDQYIAIKEMKREPGYYVLADKLLDYVNFLSENGHCDLSNNYFTKANTFYANLKRLPAETAYLSFPINSAESAMKLASCFYKVSEYAKAIEVLKTAISLMKERANACIKINLLSEPSVAKGFVLDNSTLKVNHAKKKPRAKKYSLSDLASDQPIDSILRWDYLQIAKLTGYSGMIYIGAMLYDDAVISLSESIDYYKKGYPERFKWREQDEHKRATKKSDADLNEFNAAMNKLYIDIYGYDLANVYAFRAICFEYLGQHENANCDMKNACALGDQEACDYLKSK